MADLHENPAIASRFSLTVDTDLRIDGWTKIEGLGSELVTETREEGGNYDFVHQLPVRMKYSNIKLTRPVGEDSGAILEWMARYREDLKRHTGQIDAHGGDGEVVVSWKLRGIIPVRWSGPSLDAANSQVATETIELAHHGFLGGA